MSEEACRQCGGAKEISPSLFPSMVMPCPLCQVTQDEGLTDDELMRVIIELNSRFTPKWDYVLLEQVKSKLLSAFRVYDGARCQSTIEYPIPVVDITRKTFENACAFCLFVVPLYTSSDVLMTATAVLASVMNKKWSLFLSATSCNVDWDMGSYRHVNIHSAPWRNRGLMPKPMPGKVLRDRFELNKHYELSFIDEQDDDQTNVQTGTFSYDGISDTGYYRFKIVDNNQAYSTKEKELAIYLNDYEIKKAVEIGTGKEV